MKRFLLLLSACILCLSNLFAQEVHGIETRNIKIDSHYNESEGWINRYGYEIENLNSIRVSVEIQLYCADETENKDRPVEVKNIVLKPNETYIWKPKNVDLSDYNWGRTGRSRNQMYYIKVKAYKVL